MTLLTLSILAIIQGITEFLPISSSAHLILFPALTGEHDQGLMIDGAVHVGTLAAVMLYFRSETAALVRGSLLLLRGNWRADEARLAWLLAVATVPVVIAGVAIAALDLADALRSVELIAWTTLVWAAALWLADQFAPMKREFWGWRMPDAVAMGLAQALSLLPGTSRSGVTYTAARALGFGRIESARLSLLMSIPATIAVGAYTGVKIVESGDATLGLDAVIAGVLSFAAALVTLVFLMRMLRTWSMTPFVLYRLALGAALLWVAYG